jgi:hypothetical protein
VEVSKDDSISLFTEKVKAERRVLKEVKREDMQVSFFSQEAEGLLSVVNRRG